MIAEALTEYEPIVAPEPLSNEQIVSNLIAHFANHENLLVYLLLLTQKGEEGCDATELCSDMRALTGLSSHIVSTTQLDGFFRTKQELGIVHLDFYHDKVVHLAIPSERVRTLVRAFIGVMLDGVTFMANEGRSIPLSAVWGIETERNKRVPTSSPSATYAVLELLYESMQQGEEALDFGAIRKVWGKVERIVKRLEGIHAIRRLPGKEGNIYELGMVDYVASKRSRMQNLIVAFILAQTKREKVVRIEHLKKRLELAKYTGSSHYIQVMLARLIRRGYITKRQQILYEVGKDSWVICSAFIPALQKLLQLDTNALEMGLSAVFDFEHDANAMNRFARLPYER